MTDMTPVGRLIADVQQAHLNATGTTLTYGDIAKRSIGQGGKGLSRQRIQQIAREPVRQMPDKETLERLANGLRVRLDVVIGRYLQALGLDLVSPMEAWAIVEAPVTDTPVSIEAARAQADRALKRAAALLPPDDLRRQFHAITAEARAADDQVDVPVGERLRQEQDEAAERADT